jgi:hypothetical protein
MAKNEEIYKGKCIVIHMHNLPNKEWMAEISIDGEPRPITRFSDASEDLIRRDALRSAKALIDTEE